MVSCFALVTHTRQGLLQNKIPLSVVFFLSELLYHGNCSISLSPYSLTASLTCNTVPLS